MVDGIHLRILFQRENLGHILLPYILDRAERYGQHLEDGACHSPNTGKASKKVVVDFSSPNLGREFSGHYFRSTVIGASIANLYDSMGWDVVRLNFIGDWGQHIGLLATGWKRFGSEAALDDDPLRHLLDVYTQIDELHKAEVRLLKAYPMPTGEDLEALDKSIAEERDELLKAMEDGDPEALALWKRFRLSCISRYVKLYSRLGLEFDDYSGESEISYIALDEVERILKRKGVYEEGEDAWIIDFSKHPTKWVKSGIARIRNKNDTTTYLLREIAAAIERDREYAFDKMLFVVLSNQSTHFQHLFGALELMGYEGLANRLQHVSFADVYGLSPNSGNQGLLFSDILDQAERSVQQYFQTHPDDYTQLQLVDDRQMASKIGILALLTETLSVKKKDKLTLDITNLINNEKVSGAFLKTTITRVRAKAESTEVSREQLRTADFSICYEDPYLAILRQMLLLPNIIRSAFEKLEPSIVLEYLYNFCKLLDQILDVGDVGDDGGQEEEEQGKGKGADEAPQSVNSAFEAALYQSALHVLENGMGFIGLAFFGRDHADTDNDSLEQAAVDLGGFSESDNPPKDVHEVAMEEEVGTTGDIMKDPAEHRDDVDDSNLSLNVSPSDHHDGLLGSDEIDTHEVGELKVGADVANAEEMRHVDLEEKSIDVPDVVARDMPSGDQGSTPDGSSDLVETLPTHGRAQTRVDSGLGIGDEKFLEELTSILTAAGVNEKSIDGSTDESNDDDSAGTGYSTTHKLEIQGSH